MKNFILKLCETLASMALLVPECAKKLRGRKIYGQADRIASCAE